MAARRLIIVMVILLGISTLLAAALPDRMGDGEEDQTASQASTATTGAETTAGEGAAKDQAPEAAPLKFLTFNADKPKIVVIPLDLGEQLSLTINSSSDDLIEIGKDKLGLVDVVGPGNPATFDIYADQPGTFGIELVDAARTIGRIEVTQPAPEGSGKASAGDRP